MTTSPNVQPTERTLYHPVLELLTELGFSGFQEIKAEAGVLDIYFQSGRSSFILEVKIEGKDTIDPIIKGIVQAYRYSLSPEFHTRNLIAISYPPATRGEVFSVTELNERTLKSRVDALILTEYWHGYETKNTIEEILGNLKAKIDRRLSDVMRVEIASNVIQRVVKKLARLIEKLYKDEEKIKEATNHLTTEYGFFLSHETSRVGKKLERNQTIHLLAYILVNQILFYFLYSKKAQESKSAKKVSDLKPPIKHLNQLEDYFEELRIIDYRPIFDILVAQRIPSNDEIVAEVNALIDSLVPLQISEMNREMYGRLIGRYLPPQTRKILASYYTGTAAADLLTNLAIDKYSDTVWDFACGSGTLLISSYNRKMKKYRDEKRILDEDDEEKLHHQFVEHDITGTDIMAFACHLSGLSLSAKNLSAYTDFLRISVMNALRLDMEKLPFQIEEARGDISKELEKVYNPQPSIETYIKPRKSTTIQSKSFMLDKVDVAILNPPFTNMSRLPAKIRQNFRNSNVSRIYGKRIYLWGYFLALADKVVKEGGKVAAITPISLLHGKDTLELRRFFLKNYSIEYIIKSVVGKPFSEGANFTDIIFIAKKATPSADQETRIVCLKENVSDFSSLAMEALASKIRTNYLLDFDDNEEYLSFKVSQNELLSNLENLMPYVFSSSRDLKDIVESIIERLKDSGVTERIDIKKVEEGRQFRPAGVADHAVVTREYPDSENSPRVQGVGLSFQSSNETQTDLTYFDKEKGQEQKVKKTELDSTLRTPIGIDFLDASLITDYVFRKFLHRKEKAHLLISNRFWLKSMEQSLTAIYVEDLICPLNIFTMYKCSKPEAKILCLYFNSIFYLVQAITFAKQSTRGYLGLKIIDFCKVLVPNCAKLKKEQIAKLEAFFERSKKTKIENIPTQLQLPTDFRLNVDMFVAESLGIKISKEELVKIYRLLWNHINSLP